MVTGASARAADSFTCHRCYYIHVLHDCTIAYRTSAATHGPPTTRWVCIVHDALDSHCSATHACSHPRMHHSVALELHACTTHWIRIYRARRMHWIRTRAPFRIIASPVSHAARLHWKPFSLKSGVWWAWQSSLSAIP